MKRFLKGLFIPSGLLSTSFLIISCQFTQNTQTEAQQTDLILEILKRTPLTRKLPKMEYLKPEDTQKDYTSEALDCMEKIIGVEIHDSTSGITLTSTVGEVIQNPGFSDATIKVLWRVKNSSVPAYYVESYHIDGFKKIPINHTHYVRTNHKQSQKVCLLKYNGQNLITLETTSLAQSYSKDTLTLNEQNIKQEANSLMNQFKLNNAIEPFIEDVFQKIIENLINQNKNERKTITKGQLDLMILENVGKRFFELIEKSDNPSQVISSGFDFINEYFEKLNMENINKYKNLLYALYIKFWATYMLEINYGQFSDNLKKIWILNELISVLKFENNTKIAQILQGELNNIR
ncbi:Uncharacterised protein [Mycoplasmopsis citelli]|uniref:Lipoprotein n=1 Tax=Mycoplasmopsis citelli TaxID=171281 RepID=A0A449B1F8_9BACT|nr:hypothetical protein [Mycoplasmopsis citelli]VEU74438.1 Uncharacterised protein [Mycoplasmopsis citelli]